MGYDPAEEIAFRNFLAALETLPTLPVVAMEGLKRALKPTGTLGELLSIVELDPPLTAKVLKVANTPYYGKPGKITSLKEASPTLGYPVMRSIILSVSAMEFFSDRKEDYGLDLGELWKHSIGAAVWSRHLAEMTHPAIDQEEAFISGLLHDIGKVIFCDYLKDRYKEILHRAGQQRIPLHQAERESIGYDHADVSNWILEYWNIPSLYSRVIRHHHHPVQSLLETPGELSLCRLVKLANQLCYLYGTGSGGDPGPHQSPGDLLRVLGIPVSSVEDFPEKVKTAVAELLERLDWSPLPRTTYFPLLMDANRALGTMNQEEQSRVQSLVRRETELKGINFLGLHLQGCSSLKETLRTLAESLVTAMPFDEALCTVYLNSRWELLCHARRHDGHCQSYLREQARPAEPYEAQNAERPLLFVDLIGKEGPVGHMKVRPDRQDPLFLDTVGLLLASCAKLAAEAIDRVRSHEQIQRLTDNLKKSLAQLDEERQRLEEEKSIRDTLLNGLSLGVLLLDRRGRIIYFNPAAGRMLPALPSRAGLTLPELFPDPMLEKTMGTVLDGGGPYQSEARVLDPATGRETDYQWSLLPIRATRESGPSLVCTLEDVTEARALQRGLMESARMASIGELAAGTAHNLRSPLGAVKGILELLVEELESGGIVTYSAETEPPRPSNSLKEQLDIVLRSLNKSFTILDDLLQFARRPDKPPEILRLSELLEGTETLLGELLRERGIRVEKDLDADRVFGRKADLMQVFLNLYSNAYKAMPKGGTIRIRSRQVARRSDRRPATEIAFADTGCGIPAENLDKIFDPFYTTSERVEGTGLGLSLTRKIVKEHGGTLEVNSKVGKGTIFLLTLPAHPNGSAGEP